MQYLPAAVDGAALVLNFSGEYVLKLHSALNINLCHTIIFMRAFLKVGYFCEPRGVIRDLQSMAERC